MTLANKELFKEYVPKKIADKQEKMIDTIITELAYYDNYICHSIECKDIGCKECLKQYFEKKAEDLIE